MSIKLDNAHKVFRNFCFGMTSLISYFLDLVGDNGLFAVVFFDQQAGAAHSVGWLKYIFSAVFLLHQIDVKTIKTSAKAANTYTLCDKCAKKRRKMGLPNAGIATVFKMN